MTVNPTDSKQVAVNPTDVNQGVAGQDSVTNPTPVSDGISSDHSVPYARFKADKDKDKARISELESKLNKVLDRDKKARQIQLEKDGKLQEALDIVKKDNERLLEVEEQFIAIEKAEREKHLALLPEDKREQFATYPVDMLRELSEAYKQSEVRGTVPVSNAPATRQGNAVPNDWTKLDDRERRSNWANIVNQYKK